MSDFKISLDDLADSSALAKKASQSFYPSGKPLKTSYSVNGDATRTLTQRDLQSVLAGDALYRSPNFALQIAQRNTESSISGILSANPGMDVADKGIKIKDPNSDDPNKELYGTTAFSQIVASGSLGKQGLSFNLPNVFDKLQSNGDVDGDGHTDTGAPFDPNKSSMGTNRPITFVDLLTAEEKEIYDERIKQVVSAGIVTDSGKLAFVFSSEGSQALGVRWQVYLTASKDVNQGAHSILNTDSSYWTKLNGKTVYTCASIIELLLSLGSSGTGIKIQGTIGATNSGFASAAQGEATDMGTIGDHSFGRAFDITAIGSTTPDMVYLSGKNIDNYKKALDLLLRQLSAIPEYLHPDLIIIDDRLIDEYGIGQGFESDFQNNQGKDSTGALITNAGIIIKNHPTLNRINFTGSSGHRDHIHMSFGPNRAGSYDGWLDAGTSDSAFNNPESGVDATGTSSEISELGQSFVTATNALKNKNALYKALIDYGNFSPEEAAIFMCIAERESGISPAGFNGKFNSSKDTPPGTADYSIGLWQINFKGVPNFLEKQLTLASVVNGKVVTEKALGYKLIDKDWQVNRTRDKATALKKMKEWFEEEPTKGKVGKSHSDPRLWNAITQIYLLADFTQKKHGWIFYPWGEYGGGPKSGWLFALRFQTAINFYVANNPGKTAEDLKTWVKTKGTDKNLESSKKYLDRWLQGYAFTWEGEIDVKRSSTKAGVVPTFTKTEIKEAAIWLRANRMEPWEKKYREAFGCEGFTNRLCAALGLYGVAKPEIFEKDWPASKPETNLTKHLSAQAHYEAVKNSPRFYPKGTASGDNPPAGYLVYWTGGSGPQSDLGHIGISLGDGKFIDQHSNTPTEINSTTWPGSKYTYVGSSNIW